MITQLPELIAKLPPADRALLERLLIVNAASGSLEIPPEMRSFVERNFGSVEAVLQQRIIKVTNRVTFESTIFNELRTRRPLQETQERDLQQIIEEGRGTADPFDTPTKTTALDLFGRVQGESSVTCANIAKLDGWHGVVIFNEFDPLKFGEAEVIDYLFTAREWAEAANQQDPKAIYYLFVWNCLWQAGASVIHGHAQMCLGRDMHFGKIERLRRDALNYQERHKRSYFNDLVQAHRLLGLAADPADMVKAIAYITPNRDREIILLTDLYSPELGQALYRVLAYFKSTGVTSFNVAVQMPPIGSSGEDWSGFPVLVRIVDRGNPRLRGNDVGSIDLFGANVATADPFSLAGGFRNWLREDH